MTRAGQPALGTGTKPVPSGCLEQESTPPSLGDAHRRWTEGSAAGHGTFTVGSNPCTVFYLQHKLWVTQGNDCLGHCGAGWLVFPCPLPRPLQLVAAAFISWPPEAGPHTRLITDRWE